MTRVFRRPGFWLCAFAIWFATLWLLSSRHQALPAGDEIPHLDKVAHFGYFFGGSGILSAFLYRRSPARPAWARSLVITLVVLGLVGALDEYHQTFTPGRSGNDPYDWLADIGGTLAGALVFRRLHRLLA